MPPPDTFDARLVSARALSPSVRELTFERVDGKPVAFQPGQWVTSYLPLPLQRLKRSYSIASAPDGSARFEIAVTRVQGGPGSTWLHALDEGFVLPFLGPQGFFIRAADDASPALMIATGTGLTPMRSMIRAALGAGSAAPMWVLLGVRHEEDVLYGEELRAKAGEHANLRFEVSLSQPRTGWGGRRGYVQAHVRELWEQMASLGRGDPHAYVCGLERMVGSVRELLRKEMGLPRQVVHTERYD